MSGGGRKRREIKFSRVSYYEYKENGTKRCKVKLEVTINRASPIKGRWMLETLKNGKSSLAEEQNRNISFQLYSSVSFQFCGHNSIRIIRSGFSFKKRPIVKVSEMY